MNPIVKAQMVAKARKTNKLLLEDFGQDLDFMRSSITSMIDPANKKQKMKLDNIKVRIKYLKTIFTGLAQEFDDG